MIDGGRFDAGRARCRREEEKRETVRPSGNGDPDPFTGGNEPVELGGETANERRIRSSWRRPCLW